MTFGQDLPISLWAEASKTVIYIQNHSPHSKLNDKTHEEAFTGIKPDVSHFRVFGCLVYIHVPKDKRSKLDPSKIKGIFVGYSESSKAYRVYIPEAPVKRKPPWAREVLQEAEKVPAPKGTFRESKRPHKYGGYVALVNNLSEPEPSTFDEANKLQVWKDAMLKEYKSIMKNNVWDIVRRPTDKSVVSSKWIYKIKHVVDGSIEKFMARFAARGFTQKEGIDYDETFAPVAILLFV
eukprot:PITA_02089